MTLRVPYPMGYYAKGLGMDASTIQMEAGKGKSIYTPISTRARFHMGAAGPRPSW